MIAGPHPSTSLQSEVSLKDRNKMLSCKQRAEAKKARLKARKVHACSTSIEDREADGQTDKEDKLANQMQST